MGYDLRVLPIDRAITFDEASWRIDELLDGDERVPLDDGLRAFVRELGEHFPFDEDRPSRAARAGRDIPD